MDNSKNCKVCNMKLDVVNYLIHRTVCKNCYNRNRRKNNKKISYHNQVSEVLKTTTTTIERQTSDEILQILKILEHRFPRT